MTKVMTTKEKTLTGAFWSFSEIFISKGIQFITGVILARLLLPIDFGLIGMIMIFIVLANVIIDSGFSQALIREKDPGNEDFSTAFIVNLALSLLLFALLFLSAGRVSVFFNEPRLVDIIRVMSFVLIINAFSIIQRTALTIKVDFKTQAKVTLISGILSSLAAIAAAMCGLGVWSLVINIIVMQLTQSICLWWLKPWMHRLGFHLVSFRKLFGFGSKIFLSYLIDTICNNVYYVIIGKFYSGIELGYFTNAARSRDVIMQSITSAIERVTYPVLSGMQDDDAKLKINYRQIIRLTMYMYFPLILGLATVAEPLFFVLFGAKWMASVYYFQLLCFSGAVYPLVALHMNILKVKGRSDITLRLEVYKKICLTACIIIGFRWGIIGILYGLIVNALLSWLMHCFYTRRLISYFYREQMTDTVPFLAIAVGMVGLILWGRQLMPVSYYWQLLLMVPTGVVGFMLISVIFRIRELNIAGEIKDLIADRKSKVDYS